MLEQQRKVVRTLSVAQILNGVGTSGTVAAGSLLVTSISKSESLAGLAQTTSVLGAAAMALPLAKLTQLGGRVSGKILLGGKDIYLRDVNPMEIRRRVGMVFQRPNPFPALSIYDNVAAGLRLNGTSKKEDINEIVEGSLKMAALWNEVKDKLNDSGISLSGGQQQRLCIARALAVKPEVILFDEPCSALDPISTGKIEELIFQLKKNYTIIIVTHNMQQAARISDFTAFFMLGELVEYNITSTIFTKPSKKITEDYITGRFG